MDDSFQLDPSSEDFDSDDVAMLVNEQASVVANGNGISGSEFVLYSVDDDIIPRQYRRLGQTQDQFGIAEGPFSNYFYLAFGGWSERVRGTSGALLTYSIPVLMVSFLLGALLTGNVDTPAMLTGRHCHNHNYLVTNVFIPKVLKGLT